MSAYCLFDNLVVKDGAKLEEYKTKVIPVVEKYQGKYVVLGGNTQVVEGDWKPVYLVMIEFPNLQLAQGWYYSQEYKELKALRLSATESNGAILEDI
jgi:uncharacterized protein (DUF1330 family)